jgi:hypothetical protein
MNLNREQLENLAKEEEKQTGPLPDNSFVMQDVLAMKERVQQYNNKEIFQELSSDEFKNKMIIEFKRLNENFPAIFIKVFKGTLEIERLEFMLKMISQINNNQVSKHQASVAVGQELVDNIVKPNLKK